MTSTSFNVGMSLDRASSKVLKPPGGVSNIFNNEPEKPIAPRKNFAHISSIVLSEESSVKSSCSSSNTTTTTTLMTSENGQSQIDAPVIATSSNTEEISEVSNAGSMKLEPAIPATPTSSASTGPAPRGRVPPGGFSSGLW